MEYIFLLGAIETVLGKGHKKARNNYAFFCPFCNHRKRKLEIQLETTEAGENPWECWACRTRGRTIRSLLKQLSVDEETAGKIQQYVKVQPTRIYREEKKLTLPKDFKPLWEASQSSVIANQVKRYLYERGLCDTDFIKYSIGYCIHGPYAGRIIIPSYTSSGSLNFFVARSYTKQFHSYQNPETTKDVIFFENLINWNVPVILCEGVFDAMAIRRNAIPLLGNTLSKTLLKKLLVSKVDTVYLALDRDMLKLSVEYCEKLLSMGKKVYLVELSKKDPSLLGFRKFTELIQQAEELDFVKLMSYKIK